MAADKQKPCTSWGCWLQSEYQAFLLLALSVILLVFLFHVMHSKDVSTADESWAKESISSVIGALLLRLTTSSSRSNTTTTTTDNTSTQVATGPVLEKPETTEPGA